MSVTVVAWLILTVLGVLVAACWGLRPRNAVLAAMPISFGLLAAAAAVIPWRLLPICGSFVAAGVAGIVVRTVRASRGSRAPGRSRSGVPSARRPGVASALGAWRREPPVLEIGALLLTMVLSTVTVMWACHGDLGVVSQTIDAMFHVNGIEAAFVNERVAPQSFATFTGVPVAVAGYPTGFAAVAVFLMQATGVHAVAASNIAATLIAGALWPSAILVLVRQVFATQRVTTLAAAALTQAFWGFPWDPLGWGVLWPTAGALAFAPLLFAGVLGMLQLPTEQSLGRRWHGTVLLVLSAVALVLFHPRELIVIIPELTLLSAFLFARHALWRAHPAYLRALSAIACLGALCVTPALWFGPWTNAKFVTVHWQITETTAESVNGYLLNGPSHTTPGLVVAALVLVGLAMSCRRWRTLWIPLVYLVAVAIDVVTATSRNPDLRQITRLWYGDRNRTAGVVPIAGVLLGVMGATLVWSIVAHHLERMFGGGRHVDRVARRTRRDVVLAACAAIVAVFVINLPAHVSYLERTLAGGSTNPAYSLVSPDQVKLYEHLPEVVAPDEYILNDPRDGSALLYAYSGRKPVYMTSVYLTGTPNAAYLSAHLVFDRNHTRICAVVKKAHIGWILNVRPVSLNPPVGRRSATGMLIPPGFWLTTPVASAGSTKLYKITGCH
ncbi:DUF6541 family protein [Nostocoides sp. HKS02]|uniref:DUF6541 family protein n=1 Tax=Nostocoides sp. HKS02 TaxID=1813880 RepID=UPI0012B49692|nr:DUF6541 family protein [Tetrasphaera sp. HKS02]QGN57610.1 hypothetical protein GKE56_06695 [Tetrasphaera sp. HKS02]